ncbi:MAG: 6-phosphofructokinase [Candidatus Magasanikbacteria bacterium CG10_big_fil_rev_8_21_14_0_10_40_10]|uniref:Pyrophosphate--fructose 6-phosphate 1-phosphotransferase n=1 Tax=Candidatus Magasanikbacteria bacterium CG10_big_fil_rev_8_21_14_0_10_40_10 TaxID=1974648 RepID=A0A2M6W4K0_9BACT|nr:MAG: 6-phosphofructokinase [Candidatus Magasanikbacteria bacterium CG10_big_fil_rev_8_21_14_0_10_40_10]
MQGKALVAQGGGPTAVINQSLVGVILEARKFTEIDRVYGARFGVCGIKEENFIDLTRSTTHNLERVGDTPGSALGSTRDKPDEKYCEEIFSSMQKHNIRYFYYIGGNDSASTCHIINEQAKAANYELRVIHIPKTIDNDLVGTDHSPGYGSAAKFVAQSFAGVNLDNLSLPGIYIGVVMGRHAGFLTAASSLARRFPDDGPHLIYLPERVFDPKKFVADVDKVYKEFGRCVVAVSEGIHDKKGNSIMANLLNTGEKDAHGNIQLSGCGALGDALANLVRKEIKNKRVRADTFGYLQRSFLGCVSDSDRWEAREVGERAVQYSVWDDVDGSVAIDRVGDYAVRYGLIDLKEVAGKTKTMPDEFIASDNMVSEAFRSYARPLTGNLEHLERIMAVRVEKK